MPPMSQVGLNISHSYGVVLVSQQGGRWEYIETESYLDPTVAETICRGMGFTHALLNSVMNVSLSKHHYNYTYDLNFV